MVEPAAVETTLLFTDHSKTVQDGNVNSTNSTKKVSPSPPLCIMPVEVRSTQSAENAEKLTNGRTKKKRKNPLNEDLGDEDNPRPRKKNSSFLAPEPVDVSNSEPAGPSRAPSVVVSEESATRLSDQNPQSTSAEPENVGSINQPTLGTVNNVVVPATAGESTLGAVSSDVDVDATLDGTEDTEESSNEEAAVTVEAKEERLLERYRSLLGRQKILLMSTDKSVDYSDVQRRFENLLQDISFVADETENNRMKALHCAVLKNLSNICQRQNEFVSALAYLTRVAEIDYTDIVMIHTMGELAVKQGNFPLAANFFQDVLALRPSHWPSLDALMTITYALNYLMSCLNCCLSALRMEPSHQRALAFVHKIFQEHEYFKEEWLSVFRQVSKLVGKPLPVTAKRFIAEAMAVKKRWWTTENSAESDPALRQLKVDFPVVAESTFKHVGELLLGLRAELDSEKMWTALVMVTPPAVRTEDTAPLESAKPSDHLISMSGVDNSMQSGDDTNKGSQTSTGSTAVVKSKRRIDPVLLEMTEKRRSARNKGPGRSDECVIRDMLKKFVKIVFGEVPDFCLSIPLPTSSGDGLPKPGLPATGSLWASPNSEAIELQNYLKNVNGLRINGLIRSFLQYFAERTHLKWPPSLPAIYVQLFYRIIHEEYLPSFLKYDAATMEECTRKVILLILCALEIVVDAWMQSGSIDELPRDFEKHLSYLENWAQSGEFSSPADRGMHLRILMLLHKWHNLTNSMVLSRAFFEEVQKLLEDDTAVILPNITFLNDISKIALAKLTEVFETSGGLTELIALYQQKDYVQVVKLALELLGGGEIPASDAAFTPTHVKMVMTSFDQMTLVDDIAQHIDTMRMLLQNQLRPLMEVCEPPDDEKKKRWDSYRASIMDLCEILLRKTARTKTGFGCFTFDGLKSWTALLIELCILLVHRSDGSMRRPSSLATWILLYRVIRAGEKLLPVSTKNLGDACLHYLEEVHEYLGSHSWCTLGDGSFLHTAVQKYSHEMAVRRLRPSDVDLNSEVPTDDIEYYLEQCFRCLYDVSKGKNRYFQHHKCNQVKLSLRRAIPLYQFFLPEELPSFDGYKNDCISQEGVILFNKICPMITKSPAVLTRDALQSFIKTYDPVKGDLQELPIGLEKTLFFLDDPDLISQHLFYLLADFYFKTNDHKRAIRLYTSDLCINPRRMDSWAGLAMSKGIEVDLKLASFKMKPSRELYDEAMEAIKYHWIAAKIAGDSEKLYIECGSKLYVLHSYLSRQLAQSEQFRLRGGEKTKLREDRKSLILLAQQAFLSAEDCEERSEAWLSQYMLGKTYEKLDRGNPEKYLAQYAAAADCLHCDGARYPSKIAYYKAPGLSVEALEMYYRTSASSLKYLCRTESLNIDGLKAVEFYLKRAEESPFVSQTEFNKDNSSFSEGGETSEPLAVKRMMDSFVLDQLDIQSIPGKPLETWRLDLINQCVAGLRRCLTRYTEHYKSIYRLARLYYEFRPLKDLQKTRDLLLGPSISWTNCPHMPCAGLFQQRKPTCFFKGIWHIKSEEIQRSLSFASHMYRAVHLLIGVSAELRENLLLLQIHQQLAKPPEADAKKFLRVVDYHYLSGFAMKSALLSVINRVEDYETDNCPQDVRVTFLREVLKVYLTARKENLDGKNMELANAMLAQAYLRLVEGIHKTHCPVPTPQNIVDKAVRYIQLVQIRPPKTQSNKPAAIMTLSTVPVRENAQPFVPAGSSKQRDSASNEPQAATSEPVDSSQEDEEADLMGMDLGMNPAGIGLDLSDLRMDFDEEGVGSDDQPSSAEV